MKTSTIPEQLVLLVRSLTKAEKRYFRLYTGIQSGEKNYITLFDLINSELSPDEIYEQYCHRLDGKGLEMATKHLYRVVLDCLEHLRDKQDMQAAIFSAVTKADILFERSLFDAAFVELEKAKRLALASENDPLQLLIRRTELKYLGALGFEGLSERELVSKQMKIHDIMKYSRNVNLHLQLYDILRYRIAYKGYARSEKQKGDLNDLVLSELNLIANSSYKGFEARKLHLLFQATYYLNTGNYKSAIRFYKELITLFETNRHLIQNPPLYYLSAIQGVVDSLHVAGLYDEMPYFISCLEDVTKGDYPVGFILEVHAMIYLYKFFALLNTGSFEEALHLTESKEEDLFKKMSQLGLETQLKLNLTLPVLYLCLGDINRARKSMKNIFGSGKLYHTFPSYKIARLINLLVQAESGNYDFFENEINSIKRNIRYEKQTYRTEKLLFRFIKAYPLPVYRKSKEKLWLQFRKEIIPVRQDKYERQLLKTFDILAYIESKLTGRPLSEVMVSPT